MKEDIISSIVVVLVFATLAFFGFFTFIFIMNSILIEKNCNKWETKIVHQNAWIQYVNYGKTISPIYHPEMNIEQTVCVSVKK